MNFKKVMLITFLLLVVLTIGAVSASGDTLSEDNLAAGNDVGAVDASLIDELGEMGEDDVDINVDDIDTTDSAANFTVVSVSEKDGKFVICTDEGENTKELYRENLADSDRYYMDEGNYCFGVSLDDINNYIRDNIDVGSDFENEIVDDSIRFVFEYQDSDFVVKTFNVDFSDPDWIRFEEAILPDAIARDNFNCDVASHSNYDGERFIIFINFDGVNEGRIDITIENSNGGIETYSRNVDEMDDDNNLVWILSDLDIIEDFGVYDISVVYVNDADEISLSNSTFQLTSLNIDEYWNKDIYVDYPFDVLKIYDDSKFEVYVNDNDEPSQMGPYGWKLADLGIVSAGEYNITIKSFDEDDNLIDEYNYTLNVNDVDDSQLRFYTGYGEIREGDNPVFYIYCPDGSEGRITVLLNDGEGEIETVFDLSSGLNRWTLDDLEIDHNAYYEMRVYSGEDTGADPIYEDSLNVVCIINANNFDCWVNDHYNNDKEINMVFININGVDDGRIDVTVENDDGNSQTYSKNVDEMDDDNNLVWFLSDLDIIDELGVYNICVVYVNDADEILLSNSTFQLTSLNIDEYWNKDIYVDYPFDVLRINGDKFEVYVNDNDEPSQMGTYGWKLADLGIVSAGEYNITIKSFDEDDNLIDEYNYTLNVNDVDDSQLRFYTGYGEIREGDNPVFYIHCPDGSEGRITILLNDDEGEIEKVFDLSSGFNSWTLDDLEIDHNAYYEMRVYSGEDTDDDPIYEDSLNVACIINENNFDCDVLSHGTNNGEMEVIFINIDGVDNGRIDITIENSNGDIETYSRNVDEMNEDNNLIWCLSDLDIIDELGIYNICVVYVNDAGELLLSNSTFQLTSLDFWAYSGDLYVDYPFEVLIINDGNFEVYVNDNDEPYPSGTSGWKLSDLGIDSVGEYNITIKSFDEDELIDEYTYTLTVNDVDDSQLRIYTPYAEIFDVNNPVLYIHCPDGSEGKITIVWDNHDVDDVLVFDLDSGLNTWTLDELGIERNSYYELRIYSGEDTDGEMLYEGSLDLSGIISIDNFDGGVDSHGPLYDEEFRVAEFGYNDIRGGTITLTIKKSNGEVKTYEKTIEDDGIAWELKELDIIDELGNYTCNVTYEFNDIKLTLCEDSIFQLVILDYDERSGDVSLNYPFYVLKLKIGRYDANFDGEGRSSINAEVFVNDNLITTNRTVDDFYVDETYLAWTLSDFGISKAGNYKITINAYADGELRETYNYELNVFDNRDDFELITNRYDTQYYDVNNPVLYLFSPSEYIGHNFKLSSDEFEFEFEITSSLMNWTLHDLGFDDNVDLEITLLDENGDEVTGAYLYVNCFDELKTRVWAWSEDDGPIYTNILTDVVKVTVPSHGKSGMLYISVNDESVFTTKIHRNSVYDFNLELLDIASEGEYNLTFRFVYNDGSEETMKRTLIVEELPKDIPIVNITAGLHVKYFDVFCPENAEGNITILVYDVVEEDPFLIETYTFEINDTCLNNWTRLILKGDFDGCAFTIYVGDDEVNVVNPEKKTNFNFETNKFEDYHDWDEDHYWEDDEIVRIYVPSSKIAMNDEFTLTITSGDKVILSKTIAELGPFDEFINDCYVYILTLEDLNYFESLSDKDHVVFRFIYDIGRQTSSNYLYKVNGTIKLYRDDSIDFSDTNVVKGDYGYNVGFELLIDDSEEERHVFTIGDDTNFAGIIVTGKSNITDARIIFSSGDKIIADIDLNDLDEKVYLYNFGGYEYFIPFNLLNLTGIENKDIINMTLVSDKLIVYQLLSCYKLDSNHFEFEKFSLQSITMEVGYGPLGDPVRGQGDIHDHVLLYLTIPDSFNITEGTIQISLDDGSVIYSKALSEFADGVCDEDYKDYIDEYDYGPTYVIWANITEKFNYDFMPENQNMTFSFIYGDTKLDLQKGIRQNDTLNQIFTPYDVESMFKISLSEEDILCDDGDIALTIVPTERVNKQSIHIHLGGGWFNVYVNDVKVEDLGRLVRLNGETDLELELLRPSPLTSTTGSSVLSISLNDLNLTENGNYTIRVTYQSDGGDNKVIDETELFIKDVTLTSNVKANYQNSSVEWLTGYGIDPVLLYLDTYYDEIDDVTGRITVYNENGKEIFASDISSLPLNNNRRYLSYSDFEDDFGNQITLRYSDGNQRSGNTTLDVLWRNVIPEDFTPVVKNDTVDDYYGSFVSLDIPDLIDEGQIIVTVKFRNNHGANISNMNVSTDFDSQAIYTFNVVDIKANYGNDFNLALADLGFYETDGDYDIDVQFTADQTNYLDVTNKTFNVKFLGDILIDINDTSRYANALPFAGVKIFEPIAAYAELYIDGVLYSHKTFEKGLIEFDSSPSWTPGIHTAELMVCDSEFGSVLNSSTITFETLIKSGDVEVTINDTVKEGENVFVIFKAPKAGNAVIKVDGVEKTYALNEGTSTIDLGVLPYGNHTIWVYYNDILDDGSQAFYYNNFTLFVGDDGHWINMPEPIVLDDEDTIKFDLGSDATGNILLYIDGVLVANKTLVDGYSDFSFADFVFGENKYGPHTYEFIYTGDATHDSLSKSGVFNVNYLFKDNIEEDGSPLREFYPIVISMPGDANGTVSIVVNGKTYTSKVSDGKVRFEVYDLPMGEYDVLVSYSGDDKYPQSSYNKLLNVSYYGVVGEYNDDYKYVSLLLPSNATGNLVVYNDNRQEKLYSTALVNGKATIDLSKLAVGSYALRAVYEGDDYDVKAFTTEFIIMPKIYISQDIVVGQTGQILVDLDDSEGHLLILVEGLPPVLMNITDGKVNYTFDTEKLSKGDHIVNFQYFGRSFDGDILLNDNNLPIDFNMHLLAKDPNVNMTAGDEYVIIDCGNATGTIEVFVNGVKTDVVSIVNGIAMVDLSQYKNGNYNFTFRYSGDSMYDGVTKEMVVNVYHKVPKITAGNMNVLYSANKKYSVTVYTKDGKPAKNTNVVFLINGKKYGSAKTNAKGVASIVIKSAPGNYKITTKALGVSVVKTLKVTHLLSFKKVNVKRSAGKLVLTASLKKLNGKYLNGKKITFKFNGKAYTAKTNKKGVAKVTIAKSVLLKLKAGKNVKYQAIYSKDVLTYTVKVAK